MLVQLCHSLSSFKHIYLYLLQWRRRPHCSFPTLLVNAGSSPERYWRGSKSQEMGGGGEQQYLSLHCRYQNGSNFKKGSDESHFNVSLIVRGKATRRCPQSHKTVSTKPQDVGRGRRVEAGKRTDVVRFVACPLGPIGPHVSLSTRPHRPPSACPLGPIGPPSACPLGPIGPHVNPNCRGQLRNHPDPLSC